MIRLCFVCLGNICRSPTAEGVMQHLIEQEGLTGQIEVDSCGTGNWHTGERADARSREEAKRRGIELRSISRQIRRSDFKDFDYLLAMDRSNLKNILALASGSDEQQRVHLFRDFDPDSPQGSEVPDPYYEGGFDGVFDICEAACRGLLSHIRKEHGI